MKSFGRGKPLWLGLNKELGLDKRQKVMVNGGAVQRLGPPIIGLPSGCRHFGLFAS